MALHTGISIVAIAAGLVLLVAILGALVIARGGRPAPGLITPTPPSTPATR